MLVICIGAGKEKNKILLYGILFYKLIIPSVERRPVSNGYMSLQRPPSASKVPKIEEVRAEPDGAYYADLRKKDYRIPLTSVSIGFIH